MPDKDLTTRFREKTDELQTTKDLKEAIEHALKVSTFRMQVYIHACHDQEDYEFSGLGAAWEEKGKQNANEQEKKKPEWQKDTEEFWKKRAEEKEARLYGPRKTPAEGPGGKTIVGGIVAHMVLPEPLAVGHAVYEIGDLFLSAPLPGEQPGYHLMRYFMGGAEYYLDARDRRQFIRDSDLSNRKDLPASRLQALCKKIVFPIHKDDYDFVTSLEKYLQHSAMRSMSYKEAESYKLTFCRRYWTSLNKMLARLVPALKLDEKIAILTAEVARLRQLGGPSMMHTGIRHALTR